MSDALPTILERFRFVDGAKSAGNYIRAILAHYRRRQWDRQITDLRILGQI